MKKQTINVKGAKITILSQNQQDYISLTDMARNFEDGVVLIEKWLRNKTRLSSSAFGSSYIIQILIPPNSRELKTKQV